MAEKQKTVFVCNECGYEALKWVGKCPSCLNWNTMEEETRLTQPRSAAGKALTDSKPVSLDEIGSVVEQRYPTGLSELDRVLGGGLVKGSLVLLGGEPGIGKSTIVLQICEQLGKNLKILYVSGEESAKQLKMRAVRLGVVSNNLLILSETDVDTIKSVITRTQPDLVIIDSIQTMSISALGSSPGSVSQIRESTNEFMKIAKTQNIPIIIVGHVNKDGAIAGPKVLEHIVDTVLYFEGERTLYYRILRAVKNRFGSTNEIGVFEMVDNGIIEVDNPSQLLLSGRPAGVPGSSVACVMEGSRPILAEVQGLVTPTSFGNPRRMSTGFDNNRVSLILAVLEKRFGYFFSNFDTYVNIVGGLYLDEPAADLAVATALVSSLKDKPIDSSLLCFGEIGLAGEIRAVNNTIKRIIEAERLGFKKCVLPRQRLKSTVAQLSYSLKLELIGVRSLDEAISACLGE